MCYFTVVWKKVCTSKIINAENAKFFAKVGANEVFSALQDFCSSIKTFFRRTKLPAGRIKILITGSTSVLLGSLKREINNFSISDKRK